MWSHSTRPFSIFLINSSHLLIQWIWIGSQPSNLELDQVSFVHVVESTFPWIRVVKWARNLFAKIANFVFFATFANFYFSQLEFGQNDHWEDSGFYPNMKFKGPSWLKSPKKDCELEIFGDYFWAIESRDIKNFGKIVQEPICLNLLYPVIQ